MFRSQWFKLVGAFAAVMVIMLLIILGLVSLVTRREFGQYVMEREHMMMERDPDASSEEALPTQGSGPPPWSGRAGLLPGRFEGNSAGIRFLNNVGRGAVLIVAVAGVLALTFGTLIFRQITRPLDHLRRAAQSVAGGDLAVRVPVTSNDEVGKVAEAFNHMAVQLEHQEQLRRQMVADVAHELRTPLTVMQGSLEAMIDGVLESDPDELGELHGEVRRLARLVEDLRLLSLADAGQLTLYKDRVDVGELVEKLVGRMAPLAETQSVTLQADVAGPPIIVDADDDRLQQALTNLIDNALRHTPPEGRVTVRAAAADGAVHISVKDTGAGIPQEELPHLFDRFWRGEKSRNRHSGGSGLGLSIVKQLAELHGGSVHVESQGGEGSTFTITLPLR